MEVPPEQAADVTDGADEGGGDALVQAHVPGPDGLRVGGPHEAGEPQAEARQVHAGLRQGRR